MDQQFFESKVGIEAASFRNEDQINRQAALLNRPVTLKNSETRESISGFTFSSGTWLNLKNSAGHGAFSWDLKEYLRKNNMYWAYLY